MMKTKPLILPGLIISLFLCSCGSPSAHVSMPEDGGRIEKTDPSAPNIIFSDEIVSFECRFFNSANDSPYTYVELSAQLKDGRVDGSFMAESDTSPANIRFETDAGFMSELQAIVREKDIAKLNGYYSQTIAIPPMYGGSIAIEYASGERIAAEDNSQVPFSGAVEALCALFEKYAGVVPAVSPGVPGPTGEYPMDSPNAVREFCDAVCKGWWIYMGADRDEFVPEIYRFTYTEGVGRAFYSEENYYIAEEHGEADHDPWSITEGCAMLTAGDGRDHRIILDDSEHMRLIAQDSGETRPFSRSSAPEAIEYLEQSELYYLADYPPEEVFVSLREDYGEDLYFDIYRAVYVREDDTELIEKYGLKDAFFDNGIEIVPSIDEDAHINLYAFTRDTEYYLCDWESDSPALTYINCPWEEFFEALQRNDGLMRVEIKTAEGIITMMREVYMP